MYLLSTDSIKYFEEMGFAGPFDLLDITEAIASTKAIRRAKTRMFFWNRALSRLPLTSSIFPVRRWGAAKSKKGIHAVNGEAYCLGADRRIVERVSQILGPDLLLCSTMLINQRPGYAHYWHYDVEARSWDGLTVWVALANVSAQSTLRVVAGSHRISTPPPLGQDDEMLLAEARRHEPSCQLLELTAEPGQFYFLDRRVWHSTWNESSKTRYAIVFTYCGTDVEVRWPIGDQSTHKFKPPVEPTYEIPCCLVNGEDRHRKNLVVDPPSMRSARR